MTTIVSYLDIYAQLQTFQFCDLDDARVDAAYLDMLAEPITISEAERDLFVGTLADTEIEAPLINVNTALATDGARYGITRRGGDVGYGDAPYGGTGDPTLAEILSVEDLRNCRVRARYVDLDTAATVLSLEGVISEATAGGVGGTITAHTTHVARFTQQVPKRSITSLYPNADITTGGDKDPPVILVFGTMRKARLIALDKTGLVFGAWRKNLTGIMTTPSVYRDNGVVPVAEYTVIEHQPGIYAVQFTRAQRDSSGRLYTILVDLTSTEFPTFADAVTFILQDTTYALGLPVNAASCVTASNAYAAAGYMAPAGGLTEHRQAVDVLNDLALRGLRLDINSAGEYTMVVDAIGNHTLSNITLGAGDEYWENVEVESPELLPQPQTEHVGELIVNGLFSPGFPSEGNGAYLLSTTGQCGGTVRVEHMLPYIGDSGTLALECSYREARIKHSARSYRLVADHESLSIAPGALVAVDLPNEVVNKDVFEVHARRLSIDRNEKDSTLAGEVTVREWNTDIFANPARVVRVSAEALSLTDYSLTYPATPTGFALIGSAAVQIGDQGKSVSYQVVQATAPAVNVSHLAFRAIPLGQLYPGPRTEVACLPSQTVQATLRFDAGLQYTIEYFAVNKANHPDFQDGLPIGQHAGYLAPGDVAVASAVTGVNMSAGAYKSLFVRWNPHGTTGTTLNHYEVQIATDAGFGAIVRTLSPTSIDVTVSGLANGTTYFAHVRVVSRSGIAGAWSETASVSTALIDTPDIDDNRVTTTKRQVVNTQTAAYSIGSGLSQGIQFSHSLGRIPLVTGDTGDSSIRFSFFAISSTQIWAVLWNNIDPPGATITGTFKVYFW